MQVYFAQCADSIKIGLTRDVKARLAQLQTGAASPLTLIASVSGDRKLERDLHKRLADFRKSGEWYLDCDYVRAAIKSAVASLPQPDIEDERHQSPNKFAAVARAIWPTKTAAHIAAIAKTNERTAIRWMGGVGKPPAIVIAAIIVEITKLD